LQHVILDIVGGDSKEIGSETRGGVKAKDAKAGQGSHAPVIPCANPFVKTGLLKRPSSLAFYLLGRPPPEPKIF
jgi:hypothetical protein